MQIPDFTTSSQSSKTALARIFSFIFLSVIIAICIFMQSCVSCPDNKGNLVKATFFNAASNSPVQPYNQIFILERDTILPFDISELNLDVESNHTTYILSNTTNGLRDTIVFNYNTSIEYLDRECGIQFEITNFHVNSSYREARIIKVNEKINEWEIHFFR